MLFEMEFLLSRGYVLEKYRKSHNCMLIIVGHSYGTMLGSKYTLTHPDKVAAYIGVGQFVDIESDIYSYEDALDKAKAKGDDTTTLEEAYRKYSQDMTLTNMMNLRAVVSKYHHAEKEANTIWLGIASPYMGINDLRWFFKQMGDFGEYVELNQQLLIILIVSQASHRISHLRSGSPPQKQTTLGCKTPTDLAIDNNSASFNSSPNKGVLT